MYARQDCTAARGSPGLPGSGWPDNRAQIAPTEDHALMVKIRLMRMGAAHAPSYRIVVSDARSPRDGRFIENIGWYNPRTEPATITVDQERAKHWLSVGAQPTESARSLLQRADVLPRPAVRAPRREAKTKAQSK